jgi:hypothetical protein
MLTKRDVMRGSVAAAVAAFLPALRAAGVRDFTAIKTRVRTIASTLGETSPALSRQVADFLHRPRPVDLVLAGEHDARALCKLHFDAKVFPPLAIFDFIKAPADEGKLYNFAIEAIRLVPESYTGPWPTPHLRDSRIERLV